MDTSPASPLVPTAERSEPRAKLIKRPIPSGEPFVKTEFRRISKVLKDAARGPLEVANAVMKLAANWERHRADADDLDATTAFKKYLGSDLAFFERRARAIAVLGEDVRRWMHHECAVWISDNIPTKEVPAVLLHVRNGLRKKIKLGHAVTKSQAKPHVYKAIGRVPEPRSCAECARLRAMLKAMGVDSEQ